MKFYLFSGGSLSSPKRHTSEFDCIRSKVSRSVSNDSMNYSRCESLETKSFETWTCSNCTLVNSVNVLVCEACETPFKPDVNKNSSVLIRVDNWDDNDSQFSLPRPSYRRSFSDLAQCSSKTGANRRSLGDGILEAATSNPEDLYAKPIKHHGLSKMCNSVSSSILGSGERVPNARSSSCDESKPLYTYIGITEPSKNVENHVYENQLIVRHAQQDLVQAKKLPTNDKNTQES